MHRDNQKHKFDIPMWRVVLRSGMIFFLVFTIQATYIKEIIFLKTMQFSVSQAFKILHCLHKM